jgi:dUTP pyrophosphatase
MKIKVKEIVKGLYTEAKDENGNLVPFINPIGDCIDLRAAEDYTFDAPQAGILHQKDGVKTRDVKFDEKLVRLGIAMQLPKGFSAKIRQRSSTTKKLRLLMASSGFIDTAYCGDTDEWMFYCFSVDKNTIHKGDRICQFEIVPNQFATKWQKLKWLFSSNVEFEWVDNLGNEARGGHGKTGVK